jgi:stringent starvation protein B
MRLRMLLQRRLLIILNSMARWQVIFPLMIMFAIGARVSEAGFLFPGDAGKSITTIEDMKKSEDGKYKIPAEKAVEDGEDTTKINQDEENKKVDSSGWERDDFSCD